MDALDLAPLEDRGVGEGTLDDPEVEKDEKRVVPPPVGRQPVDGEQPLDGDVEAELLLDLTDDAGSWRLPRVDDPAGQVGVETILVVDEAGAAPVVYQVPLTYRAAPLDGAQSALVGTMEHSVLGRRWVYDGPHDPVYAAQLLALEETLTPAYYAMYDVLERTLPDLQPQAREELRDPLIAVVRGGEE